ncbi:MAG: sulfatase, partial [Planctomycetota bacterium]
AYDYQRFGYPGWFPTRRLADWQAVRQLWEPWVFRAPDSEMKRPSVRGLTRKLSSARSPNP